MSTPTPEFAAELRAKLADAQKRRRDLRARCESFLTERRDAGISELGNADAIRYRSMSADLSAASEAAEQLEVRVRDYEQELSRVGSLPPGLAAKVGRTGPGSVGSAARLAPLGFPEQEMRRMQSAALRGETCRLESRDYSSPVPLLPSELFPYPVAAQHEGRILDRLVGVTMETASISFIRHTSTTGTATAVAEGQPKSEVKFVTDALTAPAVKIAAHGSARGKLAAVKQLSRSSRGGSSDAG